MKRTDMTGGRFFDVRLQNDRAQAATMVLSPGQSTGGPTNSHPNSDQWLYVVSGEGEATVDGEEVTITAGEMVLIEQGETHEIRNPNDEPLETVNLYVPPEY